jgi:hypothetical protein
VLETGISLVDETPPTIAPLFLSPAGMESTDLHGEYFGGDSIRIRYSAMDNHEVRELIWEVLPAGAGLDGSLDVSGSAPSPTVFVHLEPESSGPFQLRLYARDAAGLVSDTVTTSAGTAHVYPTVERPTASAYVDGDIADVVVDPKRGLAYLLQQMQERIVVLSLATMTVEENVPMSSFPTDFDISPGGDSLVIALAGERALGVIDLRQSPLQLRHIPLTALDDGSEQQPARVRTLSNGKVFVSVTGSAPSAYTLVEVDLATGTQRVRTDAGDGGIIAGALLGRSLDHSIFVMNGGPGYFQRYDVLSDHFGGRTSASIGYAMPALDATGRYVAVGIDVYDESLQLVRTMSTPVRGGFISTAFSPDGAVLYQMISNTGLVRSRLSDGALLDRTINPISAGLLRVSDDGTLAVTFGDPSGAARKISKIDLR